MMKQRPLFLTLTFFLICCHFLPLCAQPYANSCFIGPEIYYVRRRTEMGAKQEGTLYGVRLGYDHIKRYHLYWGIDELWATGTLKGSNKENHLVSEFTDANIEGRLGYTFQSKRGRCFSFTPYLGLGYYWQYTNYTHPKDRKFHHRNTFAYVPIGFLSKFFLLPHLSVGANFKLRVLISGKNQVSHDSEYPDSTQHYEEHLQYRGELPITYYFNWNCHPLAVGFVPFYEYRHYGKRANFPFDFPDTQLQFYGATVQLLYLF